MPQILIRLRRRGLPQGCISKQTALKAGQSFEHIMTRLKLYHNTVGIGSIIEKRFIIDIANLWDHLTIRYDNKKTTNL